MAGGEEVVGGVVGFLRMDISDFERDMLKALAMVKALDGQDIDIKVKTNSKALEKDLAGVASAAKGAGREVGGMGESFKGLRDPRVIVAAVVAGMSLLGPATGAATAAVGGLVGVVGTGILAFQGLKKEIEDGTALGVTLQGALKDVGGEFTALGTVAARSMSSGVLASLSTLRHELPFLSKDVASLGEHLGEALSISTTGLLSGLHTMMPLLQDGGRYAEILAQKFADFAASQDFKDFVDYSRRELPNVFSALMSLATGITQIGVALAPVGDQIVTMIDFTGDLASALAPVISLMNAGNHFTLAGLVGKVKEWKDGNDLAADAIDVHMHQIDLLQSAASATATSLGTTDQALRAAYDAQTKHTQSAKDATLQMQVEGDAAGLLKQQLDKLNGKALSVASTQNAFDSALANSNKHIAANGKTIDRATTSLAGNSAAAVANRGELIHQVQAAEDAATAMRDNGASQDETRTKMIKMRDEIMANAKEHHLNTAQVQAFIDKIYKIPKKVAPTKLEVQTAGALKEIAAFQKAIDILHGKTVTAKVHYAYSGKLPNGGTSTQGGSTFRDGGQIGATKSIPGYAGGTLIGPGSGTSDSILAMVAQTQEMVRLSTGEFISTDASRRRNRAALEAGNKGATLTAAGAGIDYERLAATIAAQMRHVVLNPTISAGSVDRAMGGSLR